MIVLFEVFGALLFSLCIIVIISLIARPFFYKKEKEKEKLFIGYSSEQVDPFNLYPTLEDLVRKEFLDKNPANCVAFKHYDEGNFGEIINDFGELVEIRELDLEELKEIKEIAYNFAEEDEEKRKQMPKFEVFKWGCTGVYFPYLVNHYPDRTQQFNIAYNTEFSRLKKEKELSWGISSSISSSISANVSQSIASLSYN